MVVRKDPPPRDDPPPRRDPPPPPRPLAKGKLKIASNPTKAQVIIDGKPTGRDTPVLPNNPIEVPVGKHKIQFKLNGKMSQVYEVVVVEGDNPVIKGEIPQ